MPFRMKSRFELPCGTPLFSGFIAGLIGGIVEESISCSAYVVSGQEVGVAL